MSAKSIYANIIQPVINGLEPCRSLAFIMNRRIRAICLELAHEAKTDPIGSFTMNKSLTLANLNHAQSITHGYVEMNAHQNFAIFGPPGASKSVPLEKYAACQVKIMFIFFWKFLTLCILHCTDSCNGQSIPVWCGSTSNSTERL